MNSRPTFIQDSRLGRVIFQIRDGCLFISSQHFGRQIEDRVDLRSLTSNYEARAVRLYSWLVICLAGCLLCAVVMWGLWRQTTVPRDALLIFGTWAAMSFGVCLLGAIRATPRLFFYVFSNQWGNPALNLIRESRQAAECDAFVAELVAHIELAQSGLDQAARVRLLSELDTIVDESLGQAPDADKWKLSIGLGVLAVGLPAFPGLVEYSAGLLFPLIFLFCVGGMGFSYYSFLRKEPQRWWSLLGGALSLIPPIFY